MKKSAVVLIGLIVLGVSAYAQMGEKGQMEQMGGGMMGEKEMGHMMVMPSDLKWMDAPSVAPGAKMAIIEGVMKEALPFTIRLKLPAGTKLPPHTHPAVERVTVISGALYLGIGEKFEPKNARALGAGSVAVMPAGTRMFAFTKKETVIQLHGMGPWGIHYLNPEDAPKMK